MQKLNPEQLLESMATALETLAFIAAEPLEDQPVEIDTIEVVLPFEGALCGESRLIASRTLGSLIADNIMADVSAQQNTLDKPNDALRELTNVITGLLFRQVCDPAEIPTLSVPSIAAEPSPPSDLLTVCTASLAAEGHPIHFSLKVRQ